MTATNFPGALDTPYDPIGTDMQGSTVPTHSGLHRLENDAIVAIETAIGITGTTDAASLRYRQNSLIGLVQSAVVAATVFCGPVSGGNANPTFRALQATDIPALDVAKITTGQLALARGGTNADLSATGGAGFFLKQSGVGAAITCAAILSADLSSALATPPTIGGTTPGLITGTTISATSFVGPLTGTASNASQLLGATWAAPAAIGTGTPAAGTFTNVTDSALTSGQVVYAGAAGILASDAGFTYAVGSHNLTITGAFQATNAVTSTLNLAVNAQVGANAGCYLNAATGQSSFVQFRVAGVDNIQLNGTPGNFQVKDQINSTIPLSYTAGVIGAGYWTIANTTASTNAANGAFVVSGGVGIAGALNVTGASLFTGQLQSNSIIKTITASFQSFKDATPTIACAFGCIVPSGAGSSNGNLDFYNGSTWANVANYNGATFAFLTKALFALAPAAAVSPAVVCAGTATITGAVTDGFTSALQITPVYNGAFTVTRHNYLAVDDVTGSSTITDSAVLRFNAAAGTHKATIGATTKATPGSVTAWVKVNMNGTILYSPLYASTTT